MHELGLIDALLRTVRRVCGEEKLERVDRIVLEVGELSGIEIPYLYDGFNAVAQGTEFEETELAVETVPGILHCNECDIDFPLKDQELICPECFGKNLSIVSGRDMTLKSIEGN
ncbi:MAG: hydrogenase maturation nickel metallochaperone HypA [Oscillospiraceae bacterium]|nr:hydrogenase maturation nickel metallochaperone HypA [Oscillospiraceae bacterium]